MSATEHPETNSGGSCPVLLLDGGLGTSLQDDYGVTFDKTTPLWSSHLLVSDQKTLLACQSDFGRVPVDIILTATYQASTAGFAKTRTSDHPDGIDRAGMVSLVRDAVRIAHEAGQGHGGRVALSIGPYGACMVPGQEYSGKYDAELDSEAALRKWHADRLVAFGEAGAFKSPVAYLALETIPRVDEIRALRKALDDSGALAGDALPYWTAALFPGESNSLPDGTDVQTAVDAMLDPAVASTQPWGIGINCTKLWKLEALVLLYEAAVDRATEAGWLPKGPPALVLYPDGTNGEVYNTTTQTWDLPEGGRAPTGPWDAQMAEIVAGAKARGRWSAVVAGGCCKTSHGMLSNLKQRLAGEGK
ncbi:homocysteine S-methyltransferase [Plectosphaerella cucumerina]|uniref:Homocysteine S-methyltransferase n=1 Tax=Plectosphaerella cucumerina TaxID=40658 RepID=A0A8K0TTC9_9PEZI|nr:homocysteine S-methyltransferase [Plectosphaerella cucumerina]